MISHDPKVGAAQGYKDSGWSLHRVYNEKKPGYKEWDNTEHDPEQFRDSDNVGGKLGSKSGNRVAVDLDCPEATALGNVWLPSTAISGKGSKRSHYIYVAPIPDKLQFYDIPRAITDPTTGKTKTERKKIIEVLTNGQQMLLPPSVADGETYSWKNNLDPLEIDADTLIDKVKSLATAVIVARNLPDEGEGRHDISLALAGLLLKNMDPDPDGVFEVLEDAWRLAGTEEGIEDLKSNIYSTAKKIRDGKKVVGGKRLNELVPGLPAAIARIWGWNYSVSDEKPTQDELRDRVLDSHRLAATGLGWRQYIDGVWQERAPEQVKSLVQDVLEDAKDEGITFTSGLVSGITDLVRAKAYVPAGRWDANKDIVVCKDHVLDLTTFTTRAHSPEDYATSKLPFNYDPNAKAPNWYRFIVDRFPFEERQTRWFIQEFAGSALQADNSPETAVWMVSEPGRGKSTFIETLAYIMGDRAGTFDLNNLNSQWGLEKIPGKTLLTATEQPSEFVRSLETLNRLISGEPVEVRRKFRDGEDYVPICKLLWAMNELPVVRNPGNGIWRRIKIVEFPPLNFPPDETLKAKLREEAPGILAWALRGLKRVRDRGRYIVPESVLKATSEFKESEDLERQFLHERCKYDLADQDLSTDTGTLYGAYKNWAKRFGYTPKGQQVVARDWKRFRLEKFRSNGMRWRYVQVIEPGRDIKDMDGRYPDEKSRYEDGTFRVRD